MPRSVFQTSSLIQSTLQRERLRSERLRALILVGLLGCLLLVLLTLRALPGLINDQLRPQALPAFAPVAIVVTAFLTYEIFALILLSRLLSSGRLSEAGIFYVNALVEVNVVSAIIAASFWKLGLPAMVGPSSLVYFLVLSFAALTLDVRLRLFAGAVASAEFLVCSLVLLQLNAPPPAPETPELAMLRSPHFYVMKCVLILAGGGVAAFVAQQIKRQLFTAIQAVQERDRAISIFGQHVSPEVADFLLRQPLDFSGRNATCALCFSISAISVASPATFPQAKL